ncbi:sigma-70 family RNA polymerase sigma factor [Spirillospora sp. CA-294931]|uniref:sigma-70 family RNA polymerase sigma factor n=1 Tax=Spirillospora sp. CA-294931 TaxID=3240042 RepID=UPI003D8C857A
MEGGEERLVRRARDGDAAAREQLISDYLPLVYNVVGRALDGHADVDDVVQDTVLRALRGLGGLRDPSRFRSWLLAIAMNQVRRRWTAGRRRPTVDLESAGEIADPSADFVEVAVARLGLSGQRREVAEATRWLDPADRELLALWWSEVAGELTRPELAAALGLTTAHAAVRVKRMKEQLDAVRVVVRALAAEPECPTLAAMTAGWDGRPAPLWRKRIARHARDCRACSEHRRALVPAESLLAGLVLIPPPPQLARELLPVAAVRSAAVRNAALVAVPAVILAGLAVWGLWPSDEPRPPIAAPETSALPSPREKPRPAPPPSSRAFAAWLSPAPSKSGGGLREQVVRLVNTERARRGCRPMRENARLTAAAQKHSEEMASRRTLDHASADGRNPGDRITAAGYRWRAWAENIAQGSRTSTAVMASWMKSPGHRDNIVNCGLSEIGVGISLRPGGPWWTQKLADPR